MRVRSDDRLMSEPTSIDVDVNGVRLRVNALGDKEAPPLVMLHGMQDVSLNLMPVATPLSQHFRVLLPDLRGHGASGRSELYSLAGFVFDLLRCMDELELECPAVFGHSLGGQIANRFAALYPERVRAMVVVEGLGPPASRVSQDREFALRREARLIPGFMQAKPRLLPSMDHARERVALNNPRISSEQAAEIAANLTTTGADGGLYWNFDPSVPMVFVGQEDAWKYWPYVECPTLIVNGDHSGEYWQKIYPPMEGWSGGFARGELEDRVAQFPRGELARLHHSGHMAHFDEPSRLAELTHSFLQRTA